VRISRRNSAPRKQFARERHQCRADPQALAAQRAAAFSNMTTHNVEVKDSAQAHRHPAGGGKHGGLPGHPAASASKKTPRPPPPRLINVDAVLHQRDVRPARD